MNDAASSPESHLYFSAGGVPVDKAQAGTVEVIEFAADGAEIARTYAGLTGTVSPA